MKEFVKTLFQIISIAPLVHMVYEKNTSEFLCDLFLTYGPNGLMVHMVHLKIDGCIQAYGLGLYNNRLI